MQLNTRGIPRYIQAREHISAKIRSGELRCGDRLPPEHDLAAQFGVSRMTIRKSIDGLVDAGLVYRRHGVGVFVSQSPFQRDHTHLTDFFATCRMEGHAPSAKLLKREIVAADEIQAEALQIKVGDELIRLTTLRYMDGTPITYHDAFLPLSLFPNLVDLPTADLALDKQHTWQLIENIGFGLANVVEKLKAQLADKELAEILETETGSPVLYGERVLYSEEGRPLKYARCFNRGDSYSLTVVLVK
ncbi:GntR family transcriptional regulator [Maridesulfovibrio sp.]|uniref:GntR family transcriptional regulator n=1 Tax=Maridesulfovibrio sp. TaxID=2795000 RepID=UPI003BAAA312